MTLRDLILYLLIAVTALLLARGFRGRIDILRFAFLGGGRAGLAVFMGMIVATSAWTMVLWACFETHADRVHRALAGRLIGDAGTRSG